VDSKSDKDKKAEMAFTWPHLLYRELLAALLVLTVLWVWSLLVNAPLEMQANPTLSPNPAKAPWYFLGLQELLVYFDPWIAGVIFPGLMIIGLMLIPYVDNNRKAVGVYNFHDRPVAVTFFAAGLAFWFGLIFIGTWLRGPSWNMYWPWESWEIHKTIPSTHNVPPVIGWAVMLLYFGAGMIVPRRLKFLGEIDIVRFGCAMFFILCFGGIFVKIFLRLFFNIKYILVTPWFNI
jgi:hypothetical protein